MKIHSIIILLVVLVVVPGYLVSTNLLDEYSTQTAGMEYDTRFYWGILNGNVTSTYVLDGQLYATGDFSSYKDQFIGPVIRWDGEDWQSLHADRLYYSRLSEFNGNLLYIGDPRKINGNKPDAPSGDMVNDEVRTGYRNSAYLHNRIHLTPLLSLTGGLRMEMFNDTRDNPAKYVHHWW